MEQRTIEIRAELIAEMQAGLNDFMIRKETELQERLQLALGQQMPNDRATVYEKLLNDQAAASEATIQSLKDEHSRVLEAIRQGNEACVESKDHDAKAELSTMRDTHQAAMERMDSQHLQVRARLIQICEEKVESTTQECRKCLDDMENRHRARLNDMEMELDQARGIVDECQAVKQQATAQAERVQELETWQKTAREDMSKVQDAFDKLDERTGQIEMYNQELERDINAMREVCDSERDTNRQYVTATNERLEKLVNGREATSDLLRARDREIAFMRNQVASFRGSQTTAVDQEEMEAESDSDNESLFVRQPKQNGLRPLYWVDTTGDPSLAPSARQTTGTNTAHHLEMPPPPPRIRPARQNNAIDMDALTESLDEVRVNNSPFA